MATLPTLYPTSDVQVGTWTTQTSGTTNLWQQIDEGVFSPNDTDYIRAPNNTNDTATSSYKANFSDTPSDFAQISTLFFYARAGWFGTRTDDSLSIEISIESSSGTLFTNLISLDYASFTANTIEQKAFSFTITSTGLSASKTDWNNARLVIRQTYNAIMSPDGLHFRVTAIELGGTYVTGATASPATILATTTLPAPTETVGGTRTPSTFATAATLPQATIATSPSLAAPTINTDAIGTFGIGRAKPVTTLYGGWGINAGVN